MTKVMDREIPRKALVTIIEVIIIQSFLMLGLGGTLSSVSGPILYLLLPVMFACACVNAIRVYSAYRTLNEYISQ